MKELFSLGEMYVCDFLKPDENPRGGKFELKLCLTDDGFVRLEKAPPANLMWKDRYWYRSGTNATMRNELKDIVQSILKVKKLKENDLWIDIACNDGSLLSNVPNDLIRVGIDPCDDSYKKEAEKHANLIIQDYFSADIFQQSKFGNLKAKVITTIAMFYDLEDPDSFLQDIQKVLDDDGLFVLQLSYSPLMIDQLELGNLCHEHIYYYWLDNFNKLLKQNNFQVVDCQLNDTNGGSFRVYVMKDNANVKTFATQPYRDVCNVRIKSLLEYEKNLKLDQPEIWHDFYNRILDLKEKTLSFIKTEKEKGKKFYVYGYSTKFATVAQFFGIDTSLIEAAAERSPYKWGMKAIGTNIPIISEDEMRKQLLKEPGYMLVGPFHFVAEFVNREQDLLKNNSKFLVLCPKFEVIGL